MEQKPLHVLHLEPIDSKNRQEAEHLAVFSEQSGFIESVAE